MANFVRHQPCDKCGSRDNLAVYSDGSTWCFGCSVSTRATQVEVEYVEPKKFWYPTDLTKQLPYSNKAWLEGYGLTREEISKFSYSPKLERHVYSVYDQDGNVVMWEGRSMYKKPKAFIVGAKQIHVLNPGEETLTVCEDIISAIKISRHSACMPLFGSSLRPDFLAKLSKQYRKLKVWLDSDKFDEAMHIMVMANNLGMDASVVFTHRDPKEYSDDVLIRKLK